MAIPILPEPIEPISNQFPTAFNLFAAKIGEAVSPSRCAQTEADDVNKSDVVRMQAGGEAKSVAS